MPDADSPVLTAASFNDALLSCGFETVEYIGAFGTDDNWLDGWTNFDPNNTDYLYTFEYTHIAVNFRGFYAVKS